MYVGPLSTAKQIEFYNFTTILSTLAMSSFNSPLPLVMSTYDLYLHTHVQYSVVHSNIGKYVGL